MPKITGPAVLSANDLLTGRVVWWTGDAWSELFERAARAGDDAARTVLAATAVAEEADDVVVGAALVPLDENGRPSGLREGRRHAGPSIALPGDEPSQQFSRAA